MAKRASGRERDITVVGYKHNNYVFLLALTMSNRPFFSSMAERAKVTSAQAASERYVLMTARCCSSPLVAPPLKLGQYTHRNTVPGHKGGRG